MIQAELHRLPVGFLEQVIDYRLYAEAKAVFDNAKSKKDVPDSPMMRLVKAITFELAHEEIAQ